MEPQEANAIAMVRGLVNTFEMHHQVLIRDEAVRAAVKFSHRYIPSRQLPDKAISLLDTACARVALSLHAPPAMVEHLRQKLAAVNVEADLLAKDARFGKEISPDLRRSTTRSDGPRPSFPERRDAGNGKGIGDRHPWPPESDRQHANGTRGWFRRRGTERPRHRCALRKTVPCWSAPKSMRPS